MVKVSGKRFFINATRQPPYISISSSNRLLKLLRELSLNMFIAADDANVIVKKSLSPVKLPDIY